MSWLTVGGTTIPVAPGSGHWDWNDAIDRRRAFDNTYRASATGGAARDFRFSTPPVTLALAGTYRGVLQKVDAQLCSGDVMEIPTMCCAELISETPVKLSVGHRIVQEWALHEVQPKKLLLKYSPGDTITGEAFTRSTTASYKDANGVIQFAAINTKRDSHYVGTTRTLLMEGTSVNRCLQSENFGTTWNTTGFGTPTRSAAFDTVNGISLDKLGDDDAGVLEGYAQTITFTGNGSKGVSVYVKKGTSTSSVFRLRSTSAAADRLKGVITWSGTVPSVALSTGTLQEIEAIGGLGVYRIKMIAVGVVASDTNDIQIFPASDSIFNVALTGDILVGGVQAENIAFCTSYIKTTTAAVTRGADAYSFPFTSAPQEQTAYAKFAEEGSAQAGGYVYQISNSADAAPKSLLYSPAGFYATIHNNNTAAVSSTLAAAPAIGDSVELVARLFGDGSVDVVQSINGGAAASAAQSAGNALAAAWAGQLLWLNSASATGGNGFAAFQSFKVVAGSRSLDDMRAA